MKVAVMNRSEQAAKWVQHPLDNPEPIKVARRLIGWNYTVKVDGAEVPALHHWRGDFWRWDGTKWARMGEEAMQREVLGLLEDAQVLTDPGNPGAMRRMGPDLKEVIEIVRVLELLVKLEMPEAPGWVGWAPEEGFEPGETVAFANVLVDVRRFVCMPKDARWFDPGAIRVAYDPKSECPNWHRAVDEWSQGEEAWKELLQRWMGYCMLGRKRYGKWMLMQGKIRAGKGTICGVIRRMFQEGAYLGIALDDVAGNFGLDGVQSAKVIAVGEVSEVGKMAGEKVCRVIKNLVGNDPMTVEAKFKRQQRNVLVHAAPMMLSNEVPLLPNKGRGLSGKMLVLPFEVGFEGRENVDLERQLVAEMEGIAAWALEGAKQLMKAETQERWPQPAGAEDVLEAYRLETSAAEMFLEHYFVREEKGWTSNQMVLKLWHEWRRDMKVVGGPSDAHLFLWLMRESTWGLRKERKRKGEERTRGLMGLRVKVT